MDRQRIKSLSDLDLVRLYEDWSEDAYAAGFMDPSEGICRQFVEYLLLRNEQVLFVPDYAVGMVATVRSILEEQPQ